MVGVEDVRRVGTGKSDTRPQLDMEGATIAATARECRTKKPHASMGWAMGFLPSEHRTIRPGWADRCLELLDIAMSRQQRSFPPVLVLLITGSPTSASAKCHLRWADDRPHFAAPVQARRSASERKERRSSPRRSYLELCRAGSLLNGRLTAAKP